MADSKITALTAISTVDPTADPLVIVDVSDTSMAASGTTKKSTINQLLGAGGTATLASATITGDLTVDTSTLKVDSANNRVGIGTATPTVVADFLSTVIGNSNVLTIGNNEYGGATYLSSNSVSLAFNRGQSFKTGAIVSSNTTNGNLSEGYIAFQTSTGNVLTERYRIDNTGVSTWSVGGTTAMTLNSTGLGVGVSPVYRFHAAVTSGAVGAFRASTAAIARLLVGNTVEDVELKVNANGDGQLTANASKYLGLGSGGLNDRVILDTSGNLLVGVTAAPSGTIGGSGFIADSNSRKQLHLATTASTSQVLAVFINPNGTVGTIETNGSSTAYNISSDYRLKEEVKPLTGALNRITALKPSTYKWKVDGSVGEGFIAHELAEVVPFAVSGQKDAVNEDGSIKTQGVDLSKIVPILVAAIQELTARVQTLETR